MSIEGSTSSRHCYTLQCLNGDYKLLKWKQKICDIHSIFHDSRPQGLFQQFWEKAPGQNWEKKIDLTSKLGEINNIEHYKGSKIYTQNQVILDCIISSKN